ncbi:MAG: M48 family metalloprotease [Microcystis sp. M04BS1]|jgi:predicted Zn-dependent protease|uniref:M48 family peptidase n=1 Tax=Microcystis aeruginosa Ma_MB_S_20031200_S102 TaxID=2486254 RepID=A0A552EJF9_MICAE|nr:M48 family metallopeptidase [Microcystis aeruginosa]MCA2552930.1 M48 family metalloprotease [Microcystis sp. M04BS1]NCS26376.1 M48 family metalloprotease [Microcystis aeruginosa BS13-02]TRU20869.1 MAG: M48 family peptidase [Microcystis aeruginosa Ma_MB_S_20031200_S102D]TRU34626.1 MAG: M48 family peptidase [Microcystis aeruginosa Ma_MB_S_20031200_S102]MDB9509585.1 M48 family metallopeptidase [Microcystis aeruginosa CS-338/01]
MRPIFYRFWLLTIISGLLTLSIGIVNPPPSFGRSWMDLLFRGVQVIQLTTISPQQEVALGRQINQGLLESGKIKLSKDAKINQYVQEIGQRLAATSDRPDLPYTFQVVRDNSINAFATMGGFVYLHTGLIKTADNEAELASVIAHEIGHIVGRHSITQLRNTALAQGLLSAAGLDTKTWVQLGVNLTYNLPNSRKDELEADRLGLNNLAEAGYAPTAMISFMGKLAQQGGSIPAILSTHPATGDRILALQKQLNSVNNKQNQGLDENYYQLQIRSLQ